MTEQQIVALAERFWRTAGQVEPFPRSLETAVPWALPLAIVKLPRLGMVELRCWLARRGITVSCRLPNRGLRGALLARAGRGFVFLDGSDPDEERRFSLAHEVAHFVKDHLHPREQALAAFGESIREVLDGLRPPAPEERLTAVFRGLELGVYAHWMERTAEGTIGRARILEAEDDADRLALELLAPAGVVNARLTALSEPPGSAAVTRLLITEFGLPSTPARSYGAWLFARRQASRSFREWLGLAGCRSSGRAPE